MKNREVFAAVLKRCVRQQSIPHEATILVVGGGPADSEVLAKAGFRNVHLSNLPGEMLRAKESLIQPSLSIPLDAEDLEVADESYDAVFAHEVLHHCRSPHRALCEMMRVARRFVISQEPNDSLSMRTLLSLKCSFPYKLPAVVANGYTAGGVRDSHIPNHIYRWNRREIFKCVSSYLPERVFSVHTHPYWDFNATEADLDLRKETRLRYVTRMLGTRNFLRVLRFAQQLLNGAPATRRQGNKLVCCIVKDTQLRPWLKWADQQIVFDREYGSRAEKST